MDLDFLTIHQIKNGDAQAAEGFIRKYYPEILRYCYLHISDRGYAEDLGHPHSTVKYCFFNTGVEYKATIDHLNQLENRYGIKIERYRAAMPVPVAVRKYGYPFLSKKISNYIHRLQINGFEWEDKPFEELIKKYPKCKAALKWWCNKWGDDSRFNISRRKWLKEFMIQNPPPMPISDMCCIKSKHDTSKKIEAEVAPDLICIGIRKAEGGQRSILMVALGFQLYNNSVNKGNTNCWSPRRFRAFSAR